MSERLPIFFDREPLFTSFSFRDVLRECPQEDELSVPLGFIADRDGYILGPAYLSAAWNGSLYIEQEYHDSSDFLYLLYEELLSEHESAKFDVTVIANNPAPYGYPSLGKFLYHTQPQLAEYVHLFAHPQSPSTKQHILLIENLDELKGTDNSRGPQPGQLERLSRELTALLELPASSRPWVIATGLNSRYRNPFSEAKKLCSTVTRSSMYSGQYDFIDSESRHELHIITPDSV